MTADRRTVDVIEEANACPEMTWAELGRLHGYPSFWTPDSPGDGDDGSGRAVRRPPKSPKGEPTLAGA